MLRKQLLGAAAVAAVLAFGAGAAHATPYGYAESDFEDFTITIGGSASLTNGSIGVATSQNYPGSGSTGSTVITPFGNGGNPGLGAAAANAFGGPNATYNAGNPAAVGSTNLVTPIGETALKGKNGAQAAASVGSNNVFTTAGTSIPGDASYDVVENGGRVGGGPLTATGSQTEQVLTITTGAGIGSVDFSFLAQVAVEALTTQSGETASASTTNTITEFNCTGGPCVGIFTFQPAGLQASVNVGPSAADEAETTASLLGGGFVNAGGGYMAFDTGAITLAPDSTYSFNLASTSTESTSSVPEPMSLMMLGSGLVGLGAAVRRRRNKV